MRIAPTLTGLALLAATAAAQAVPNDPGPADPGVLTARPGDVLVSSSARPDGGLRTLAGRLRTTGSDLEARAATFLTRYGAAFGVDDAVRLRAADAPRRVPALGGAAISQRLRLEQRVHGHVLQGHGLVLSFDERGDVRRVHGVVSREAAATATPRIDAADAAELALARTGWTRDELAGDPDVRPLARLRADGVELLHRVEVVRDLRPWAIEIDARDGSLLRVVENSSHGQGTINYDGVDVAFSTGAGVGNVYKGIKASKTQAEGSTSLKQLGVEDIGELFPDGTLTGRFVQVVDSSGGQIVNSEHDFRYLDDSDLLVGGAIYEYQLFDHVNTFYWLTRAGLWFAKLKPFAGDRSVLTYVNYDDNGAGYVNAFYSPADPDGAGGYAPGYFLFGEFSGITDDPMDDLSRDPSIVVHEYTHMVVDQDGHTFGDAELDTPPRALNEGLADYAAASMLKAPAVGEAFVVHGGADIGFSGESFRDLSSAVTMPDDLWAETGFATGLPEEHAAGEIFAAALWRARKGLKKAADITALGQLGELPLSTAEVGYPTVSVGNATDAYTAYFYACFEALADLAAGDGSSKQGQRAAAALLGAFMAHGIAGLSPDTTYRLDATQIGMAARFESAFLGSLDEHVFELELAQGQTVKLAAKGLKGTSIDVALGDSEGGDAGPEELTVVKEKKVNSKGTSAVLPGILVGTAGVYRVTVSHDGEGGGYKLLIKVK